MIEFQSVTKIYNKFSNDEITAINNISFKINENELIILKGNSGSGKSTILSLISGLIKPTQGNIIVNKKQISKLPDKFASAFRRNNIGFIFQKFNLIENLTSFENTIIPLIPKKKFEINHINELFEIFKITDKKNTKIKYLSGGERQKIVIIRALANNPNIILADEPTANLDKKSVESFKSIISNIHEMGKTIIIATHDARLLDLPNHKKIILENGEILENVSN
jgi:putative ABC transport system ATP-binding protein